MSEGNPGLSVQYIQIFFKCKFENECCYYARGIKGSITRLLCSPFSTGLTEREGCEKPILRRSSINCTQFYPVTQLYCQDHWAVSRRDAEKTLCGLPEEGWGNLTGSERPGGSNLFCKFLPLHTKLFLPKI